MSRPRPTPVMTLARLLLLALMAVLVAYTPPVAAQPVQTAYPRFGVPAAQVPATALNLSTRVKR